VGIIDKPMAGDDCEGVEDRCAGDSSGAKLGGHHLLSTGLCRIHEFSVSGLHQVSGGVTHGIHGEVSHL
jgi:hypothetical protein